MEHESQAGTHFQEDTAVFNRVLGDNLAERLGMEV